MEILKRTAGRLKRKASRRSSATRFPDMEPSFMAISDRVTEFTMTSIERQYALWNAVKHLEASGVEGEIVECGVWKGGSSMLAAATLLEMDSASREIWMFDTFEGMSEPTDRDVDVNGFRVADEWVGGRGIGNELIQAFSPLDEVRANMATVGYPDRKVHFVQGKVEETIPENGPERIALLRLDTDWYESTRHEIEHFWPRLVAGGVLIIDDYGHWKGSREAIDEYFEGREDRPLLNRIDYTGRIGIKPA